MVEETTLDIPSGVRPSTVMDFLGGGHGYTWKTVSKEPILMVLGTPSKGGHPEVVIVNDSLVVSSPDENMTGRMTMMLEVLARQTKNGIGGRG